MNNIPVEVGDTVDAQKFVYDTTYSTTGIIERLVFDQRLGEQNALIRDERTGETDWYRVEHRPPFCKFVVTNRPNPSPLLDEAFLSQSVEAIQHQLAERARQSGHIPHGQLWQPCEKRGCDNEPVCMNCMMCQDKHCHCFDGE